MHIISGLDVGGSERSLAAIAGRLDPRRFRSEIVSLIEPGAIAEEARAAGIPVTTLHMQKGRPRPSEVVSLARRMRLLQPTIIQTWLYHADIVGLLASRLALNPNVVWNIRCSNIAAQDVKLRLAIRVISYLSGLPQAVIANSVRGREAHEALGYRPRRWVEIPNGVDLVRFRPRPGERQRLRLELGIKPESTVVGMVARYHSMKDHTTFLKSAAALSEFVKDVEFVLCGKDCDPQNEELINQIKLLGIESRVKLIGMRLDPENVFPAFDLTVSSSAFGEGSSNVLLEAMACAVPCVVTDVGDSARIIGSTGIAVPPRDPTALMSACREMLGRERLVWGDKARARAVAEYDLQKLVARYEALYGELAARIG